MEDPSIVQGGPPPVGAAPEAPMGVRPHAAPAALKEADGCATERKDERWLADSNWWEDAACCCEERCGVPPEGRQADATHPDI